jgi:hypothetical protein
MRYRIGLILIVLLVGLAACSNLGAQQSPYDPRGCDKINGVCIKIKVEKELVELGEAVPITITVTSEQDQSDLSLDISVGYNETFDGKVFFSDQDILIVEEGSYWKVWEFDIEKDQPRIFKGTISFSPEKTIVPVRAVVFRGAELRVTDYLEIYFTESGGQVYYLGTKKPHIDVPLIETLYISTYTPGPSPTWAPSATWPAYIATREALTQQAEPKTPQP